MSATPSYSVSTRPLVLLNNATSTRVSISVASSREIFTAAEVLQDAFHDFLNASSTSGELIGFDLVEIDEDNVNQAAEDAKEKELVLVVHFLNHVSALLQFPSETSDSIAHVLLSTFTHFSAVYLTPTGKDVHSLAATFPTAIRSLILTAYFSARTKLETAGLSGRLPLVVNGGLLAEAVEGKAQLFALFGGQGMNEVYFDELQVSSLTLPREADLTIQLIRTFIDSLRPLLSSTLSFLISSFDPSFVSRFSSTLDSPLHS
jgi:fatty acid synthase subunit beta